MKRAIILFSACLLTLALAAGCGGEPRTTAQGHVLIDTGTSMTGFELPSEARIDDMEASTVGRLWGSCEIRQVIADERDEFNVHVELNRGTPDEDLGLTQIVIDQRTDARPEDGMVDVMLGDVAYASGDSNCEVRVDYAVSDGGMVGVTSLCQVSDGESTANADIELYLTGCLVAE